MEKSKFRKIMEILLILLILILVVYGGTYLFKKNNITIGKGKKKENPEITFNTNFGSFTAELYPDKAPNTVKNILALASSGYYNGKIIYGKDVVSMHLGRLKDGREDPPTLSDIDQDVVKGSDKDIKYSIKGEFTKNSFNKNNIPHERYVLSIARPDYTKIMKNLEPQSFNAGNSIILIVTRGGEALNGRYSAFGKVIKGRDVIDKIESLELKDIKKFDEMTKNEKDPEKKAKMEKALAEKLMGLNGFEEKVIIESVNIDTKGITYGSPEYIKAFNLEEYVVEKYKKEETKEVRKRGE